MYAAVTAAHHPFDGVGEIDADLAARAPRRARPHVGLHHQPTDVVNHPGEPVERPDHCCRRVVAGDLGCQPGRRGAAGDNGQRYQIHITGV